MANARANDRDEGLAAEPSPEVATQPAARVHPAPEHGATSQGEPRVTAHEEPRAPARDGSDASGHDGHRAAPHPAQRESGGAADAPELGRNPEVEDSAFPPHEPGSMDIAYHEETYHRFIRIVIRTVIGIFVVLILLALING